MQAGWACVLAVACGVTLLHRRPPPTGAFITYATPEYLSHARQLCESARLHGFASARVMGPDSLDSEFGGKHAHILSQARGAGYWLWKPYIIKHALDGMKDGEHMCYCDALYRFVDRPRLDETTLFMNKPGQAGTRFPVGKFTKMDVLAHFHAATPAVMRDGQLWAGCLYLVKDRRTVELVDSWLQSCRDAHLLTDSPSAAPNDPMFTDHRHDQSVLDLWARAYGTRVVEAPAFLKNLQTQRPPLHHHHHHHPCAGSS